MANIHEIDRTRRRCAVAIRLPPSEECDGGRGWGEARNVYWCTELLRVRPPRPGVPHARPHARTFHSAHTR